MKLSILILDDEKRVREELEEYLRRTGCSTYVAANRSEALQTLQREHVDIMILDIKMPEVNGIDLLKQIKPLYPDVEVIMISGHGDMDSVIEAMRAGAADYLKKPFRHSDLQIAIERTSRFVGMTQNIRRLEDSNSLISRALEERISHNFISESESIKQVISMAMRAASFADTPVLITGESGTGKEIIARIIHYASPRKANTFCAVNCTATPENLMESEFFGYKRGAFTGAMTDKKGFFELANHGTLFLDEIADMPLLLQAKLLRALEEHKIQKLGSDHEHDVDVRIVSATNCNLEQAIQENKFRLDLYHRINTFLIHIPPLRERKEDIPSLVRHFILEFCQRNRCPVPEVHPTVFDQLGEYSFPGNVRELRNLVERAMVIRKSNMLTMSDFPLKSENTPVSIIPAPNFALQKNTKQLIQNALAATGNNQTKAAELLGISRHSLIRKMAKYKL